jgi:hypothetical protein
MCQRYRGNTDLPPKSLKAQHPIDLNISLGNASGPTAPFEACSINSILNENNIMVNIF